MSKKSYGASQIGKTKRSTDSIIDEAIARQNSWMSRRRDFAKKFLKRFNLFARPAKKESEPMKKIQPAKSQEYVSKKSRTGLAAYWFPILCALLVIFVAIWVMFIRVTTQDKVMVVPVVPEPVVQVVDESMRPTFDIVRVENNGNLVVAGRWLPHQNISIVINNKIVATERTDSRGEFVYSPSRPFAPGNYVINLVAADTGVESEDNVFIYVSPKSYDNSVSLLMTKDGSTLLQSPKLMQGDLIVSKIDYLENGRIVVTGNALPRLRVSLTLNEKYIGFARVSDHKHFGLGADIEKLESGKEYNLGIRLHDGDGKTVAQVSHKFVMPEMTGDDNTFYTVRRGDCLWIIARNFLRRGVLFSIIVERNNIENPDLIYPKQILQIPTKVG